MTDNPLNRRDFLRGASLTSLGLAFAGQERSATAQNKAAAAVGQLKPAANPAIDDELKGRPVKVAVIGLGVRGKEILASLARMGDKYSPVVAICDNFSAAVFVKRAQAIVPGARFEPDYRKLLEDKTIEAVFIATPTHKHKQIAEEALQAGKHVFLEAPLAHTVEEAKAIAQAAKSASTIFQPGLQSRCNAQTEHVHHFILSDSAGKITGGSGHWHKRTNWRQVNPNGEREAELNWRLNRDTSPGLLGEVGIHQIDEATWFYNALPTAVTGFGSIMELNDGRTVADTVQAVIEYPKGLRYVYDATLTSSFDDAYEIIQGTQATVMLRDQRGWMFKEADAAQLGWEVFARKDTLQIGKPENGSGLQIGNGIALVADASKQLALGKQPGEGGTDLTKSGLYQSCRAFLNAVRAGKRVPVKEPTTGNPHPPLTPGYLEGYQATLVALKANESAISGNRIVFDKAWFDI